MTSFVKLAILTLMFVNCKLKIVNYQKLQGFTLIELLIVMAILGILSALGIGNFSSAQIKARDVARKSDLATIAKSLEAYANDHRSYPSSDTSNLIICQPSSGDTCIWGSAFTDGTTLYMAKLPEDPNGEYQYISTGDTYTLYAHLENANDPKIVTITPSIDCGSVSQPCNYKLSSSNVQ